MKLVIEVLLLLLVIYTIYTFYEESVCIGTITHTHGCAFCSQQTGSKLQNLSAAVARVIYFMFFILKCSAILFNRPPKSGACWNGRN